MKTFEAVRSLFFAGGLLASAIALSPTVDAHDKHHKGKHKGHHHGQSHGDYRFVEVPRHMHAPQILEFHNAYAGRVYYRPHRHHHVVYRYPVVVAGVVKYQPYYYCNDELFVTAQAPLPRVVVGVDIRPGVRITAEAY